MADYHSIRYRTDGRLARITLDRPERRNAIDDHMPGELRRAVEAANADDAIHVIVLDGAGEAFCAGYDLKHYAEGESQGVQADMPWDPMADFRMMKRNTDDFMSLWRSDKPTVVKLHGYAVAGGSDIALCADLIVMAEDARIGYMPTRVWGTPTTAMWVHRLGPERAKRLLLTGDTIDGVQAERWGLVHQAVPAEALDAEVERLARRIAAVPRNQLMMQKLLVNTAYENMGMATSQILATLFDGVSRHSPEGMWFKQLAEREGFHEAVEWRDSGRELPDGEAARAAIEDRYPRRGGK